MRLTLIRDIYANKEKLLDIEIAIGDIIFIISDQIIRLDMERV